MIKWAQRLQAVKLKRRRCALAGDETRSWRGRRNRLCRRWL